MRDKEVNYVEDWLSRNITIKNYPDVSDSSQAISLAKKCLADAAKSGLNAGTVEFKLGGRTQLARKIIEFRNSLKA